ncbi:MAG: formylglycine-generating enzyme family protein, partial [Planctomycetota bacterium]
MRRKKNYAIPVTTSLLCLVALCLAWLARSPWLAAAAALGLCYVLLRLTYAKKAPPEKAPPEKAPPATPAPRLPERPTASRRPVDPADTDGLVERMLEQGRWALLLRPKVVSNLTEGHLRRAREALEENLALVPDGEVVLGQIDEALDDGKLDEEEIAATQGRVVRVERFFLDRFPVTNQQFHEFVADGGYEQMPLWEESIWTAVLDLVDGTGMPGPRYWKNGCFPPGEEDHPVVGVSWYEASAYARWAGRRLPTDAEWVKAGSWPVPLSATTRSQRKYPWGDTMDRNRANLWNSRSARVVPVEQYPEGVSVGGVYQLIGNVWEWTSGNFRAGDHVAGRLELPTPMKNIRGGAFDTYFDNQATCQFQSGETPLGRRRNIGFRCAVGVCDLVFACRSPNGKEEADDVPSVEHTDAAPNGRDA